LGSTYVYKSDYNILLLNYLKYLIIKKSVSLKKGRKQKEKKTKAVLNMKAKNTFFLNDWRSHWELVLTIFFVFELRTSHLLGRCSTTWITSPTQFCVGCVWDRVSQTVCLGWLWTTILLISASRVAKITGVSHDCPVLTSCCSSLYELEFEAR
jgi:hypothetical protein